MNNIGIVLASDISSDVSRMFGIVINGCYGSYGNCISKVSYMRSFVNDTVVKAEVSLKEKL